MSNSTKYALLDTDFISKAHLAQKDGDHHLIDIVLNMPGYEFFCHEQIVAELSRHNIGDSREWLSEQITKGKIHCYSDARIMDVLRSFYFSNAGRIYLTMLEIACNAFKNGSYICDYAPMQALPNGVDNETFLSRLTACDQYIGEGKSLGEKKSYVLLQLLKYLNPGNVYVFCSDDENARKGAIALSDPENPEDKIYCISILSLFQHLSESFGYKKDVLEPYFAAYENFCKGAKQVCFKVYEASKVPRMTRVPCHQVFEEIFEGKYEALGTGTLRYKTTTKSPNSLIL